MLQSNCDPPAITIFLFIYYAYFHHEPQDLPIDHSILLNHPPVLSSRRWLYRYFPRFSSCTKNPAATGTIPAGTTPLVLTGVPDVR
ncbi:MAG: hypothetical protein NTZ39_09335 [Methanoregula sp.]|nr:hypothetical protein [Methanoregula sp.]